MKKSNNTETTHNLFKQLHDSRLRSYKELSSPAFKGVWDSVMDLYPESAHFLFELLQNADDALAESVSIILYEDGLVFKHDGKVHFTVTPVSDEGTDNLGHINSITSIGNSTKQELEGNKIGKFGLGFKSVFQYCETPEIYDDVYKFKLEHKIVPTLLKHDHELRNPGETLFYFPFISPEEHYEEIKESLQKLENSILFLNHLQNVSWEDTCDYTMKRYTKEMVQSHQHDDITCSLYKLKNNGAESAMWMFSRNVAIPGVSKQFPIIIGFYLDKEGQLKTDAEYNVSCFFETSETFESCFVSHAPFLLTNNRSQIKSHERVNNYLVSELGNLVADVLLELRDMHLLNSNIFKITGRCLYYDDSLIGPNAIYRPCRSKIRSYPLLLARGNEFLSVDQVYLPSTNDVRNLLSARQLSLLTQTKGHADFLDDGFSRESCDDWSDFGVETIDYDFIANHITPSFMSKQSNRWISNMFALVLDRGRASLSLKHKSSGFLAAPIIKTSKGDWVRPFENEELNVFYSTSTDADDGYNIVDESYAENKYVRKFLDEIGCKQPDKEDYIKTRILQACSSKESIDVKVMVKYLGEIFDYAQQIEKSKYEEFCDLVSQYPVLVCPNEDGYIRVKPSSVLLDTPILKEYVKYAKDVHCIKSSVYSKIYRRVGKEQFHAFLKDIHIRTFPNCCEKDEYMCLVENYQWESILEARDFRYSYNPVKSKFRIKSIEGLEDVLANNVSLELSKAIWSWIISYNIENLQTDVLKLFHYSPHYFYPESQLLHLLKTSSWLYNKERKLKCPEDVSKEELLELGYEHNQEMFSVLEVISTEIDLTLSGYSEEDNDCYKLGRELKKMGSSIQEFGEFKKWKHDQAISKNRELENNRIDNKNIADVLQRTKLESLNGQEFSDHDTLKLNLNTSKSNESPRIDIAEEREKLLQDVQKDYEKRVREVDKREILSSLKIYTKEWFETLLELEYGEEMETERNSSRAISITFGKVTKESDSERILVLKNPSRCPIPLSLEQIGGIEVKFSFVDREDFVKGFEVASVRDFTLRLKAKQADLEMLNGIDWTKCTSASIDANNPAKLMSKFISAFHNLNLPDGYNLKENLKSNISFIFGPPGTGKTTHLANEITNIIKENPESRILVLCPTNKACDVLTEKLYRMNDCKTPWLGRFVATGSETIENWGLVWDRNSRNYMQDQYCIVSTIARLPYDGFSNSDDDSKLRDMDWDYVIIDEASMIPLAQIVYAIYKFDSYTRIIIAGDPMQITPIVHEDAWKRENIYSMVNLNTFANPKTEPLQFDITNLKTQYRSVPAIGSVFSNYSYSGLLNHYRKKSSALDVTFNGKTLKPLTLIPFNVSRMDNVFRPYKLSGSNVHIYSVLLVSEICRFLSKEFSTKHGEDSLLRVGVICPYVAEAQLIDKIIEQMIDIPENVQITVGTIHGFQGDECDVVFVVLNPPLGLKQAPDKIFLNNHNILNVAISRARDYLFLLYPHKDMDGFENLVELKKIGLLMCQNPDEYEYLTSDSMEEILFGKPYHIEQNVFVTTHQLANVYTEAAKKFEIRIDESSVDVQIAK